MTRVALLVTGARALDPRYPKTPGTEASRRWAVRLLERRIMALPARAVVFTGGCEYGPDAWAKRCVFDNCRNTVDVVEYRLNGIRYVNDRTTSPEEEPWPHRLPLGPGERKGSKGWPLVRNEAMVAALAGLPDDWTCRVLALIAPWAATGGTMHTAKLAAAAGLDVEVCDCPGAHGPR
jgi:hypothetical protein